MPRTARASGGATDSALLARIQKILRAAQASAARTVNTAHVISSWLIGREIVEDEQRGRARASYQERTLKQVAERLTKTFGVGYSAENLKRFRQFYLVYPDYLNREQIGYALRTQFGRGSAPILSPSTAGGFSVGRLPGGANLNLAWGHYRVLMRVDNPQARSFYEIEAIKNSWSTRELERQVASLLYERLAKSCDKRGVMLLATKLIDQEVENLKSQFGTSSWMTGAHGGRRKRPRVFTEYGAIVAASILSSPRAVQINVASHIFR